MKKFIYLALLATTMSFAQTTVKEAVNDTKKQIEQSASDVKNTASNLSKTAQQGKASLSSVYGYSKDGIKTVYGDLSSLGGEAKGAIKDIVKELKQVSVKAWDLLVRQQMIWSLCYLSVTLSSLIFGFRFFKQLKLTGTDLNETGDSKTTHVVLSVVYGIFFISTVIYSSLHLEPMLTGFFNAEFGALRTLIELGQKIK